MVQCSLVTERAFADKRYREPHADFDENGYAVTRVNDKTRPVTHIGRDHCQH